MGRCACVLDEGQESYLNAEGYRSLYMKLEDGKYYILTYDAGETKVEIYHCPFCGRHLGPEPASVS